MLLRKFCFLFCTQLLCFSLYGNADSNTLKPHISNLSLRVLDFSTLVFPEIPIQANLAIDKERKNNLILGAGYLFYALNENVKMNGIAWSADYYRMVRNENKTEQGWAIGYENQLAYFNNYILVQKNIQAFEYLEYEKTKYQKRRNIYRINWKIKHELINDFFIQTGFGFKLIDFKTILPENVVQKDFRNNLFYTNKNGFYPFFDLSLNVGYQF